MAPAAAIYAATLVLALVQPCISAAGANKWEVMLASDATPDEAFAAQELAGFLSNASSAPVPIVAAKGSAVLTFAVGYGAATSVGLDKVALEDFGNETFVVSSNASGGRLAPGTVAITGGHKARRGALYGVYHLLRTFGFRFYAPTETVMPSTAALAAAVAQPIEATYSPPMELRTLESFETNGGGDPSAYQPNLGKYRTQGLWGMRNHVNGDTMLYAEPPGSVHTSYGLLYSGGQTAPQQHTPPADLFKAHPEWFSQHWSKSSPDTYGQLCWSNTSLISYISKNVKSFLQKQPDAVIISVSQNDNRNYCQSPSDMAIIAEEGSPMGPMLRAVNQVADSIKDEFPHVAIDTLAYEYTRPAPLKTTPRKNVIIRLCSIECNFAAPLTDPSNAPFQHDMDAWAAISNRTFIWDYVVNFGAYVMPFPNYYVIGPNIRYYLSHGVRGMYEEGNGHGPGSDLDAMKAYLMTRVMYNQSDDDAAIISDFLEAYYSAPAAPFIRLYMDTMHGAIADTDYYMRFVFDHHAAFLTPIALIASAEALSHARAVTAPGSRFQERVDVARLAVYYPILLRWEEIRGFAANESIAWPLEPTKAAALEWFVGFGGGLKPPLTHLNEGGSHDLGWFKNQVGGLGAAGAWD